MLQRALQSVLNQDYPNIEIIVVDDGSTAECYEHNKLVCRLSNNISLIRNQQSEGACNARNRAIFAAKGEFITGLDDDDEFLPDRISSFVQSWTTGISALCTGYKYILPGGKKISSSGSEKQINCEQIKYKNDVGNQIFTRTSYLQQIGGFDPKLVACQDYDVWIRLICIYGPIQRLAKNNYVVHQEHEHARISQFQNRLLGHNALIEKHKANMNKQQLSSQYFFCALYGGETRILKLLKLAGFRHLTVLAKMLLIRILSKSK